MFLVVGHKVNIRFNCCSQQTQAGMLVSSTILFRVSLFNRVLIEKALSQIMNIEHIFSAKSLKRGQLPQARAIAIAQLLTPGYGLGYPSIISKCFHGISVEFSVCFLVFGAVMPP